MRCDQFMGLPQSACDFLGRFEKQAPICPTCKRFICTKPEVIGHYHGMFMEEYDLYRALALQTSRTILVGFRSKAFGQSTWD